MFVYSRFNVLSLFTISLLFIGGVFLISCNDDDDTPMPECGIEDQTRNDMGECECPEGQMPNEAGDMCVAPPQVETKEMRGYFFTLEGDTQPEDKSEAVTCDSEDITLEFEYLDKDDKSKGARVTGSSTTEQNRFIQEGFLIKDKEAEGREDYHLSFSYVTTDGANGESYSNPGIYNLINFEEPDGEEQVEEYVGIWSGRPNKYDYVPWVGCSYIMMTKARAEKLNVELSGTNEDKVKECRTKIPYLGTKTFCLALTPDGTFEDYTFASLDPSGSIR